MLPTKVVPWLLFPTLETSLEKMLFHAATARLYRRWSFGSSLVTRMRACHTSCSTSTVYLPSGPGTSILDQPLAVGWLRILYTPCSSFSRWPLSRNKLSV